MSAYLTLLTPMTDQECLLAALADLGFDSTRVEVHTEPVALVGYVGDARSQAAHIIIRRQHVGAASNDLGFRATPTGYQLIVSDYDRRAYGQEWLTRLHARYEAHSTAKQARLAAEERRRLEEERRRLVESQRTAVIERAKKMGYQVKETREGEKVRLVLLKRTY